MKTALKFLTFFVASVFLSACSDETHAGGGIWDETQNTLAVKIFDVAGNPAANARVRLVTKTATVADSALSDASGTAFLSRPVQNGYVEIEESSGVSRRSVLSGDSLLTDTLSQAVELSGTLETGAGLPQTLYLFGTSYTANVSANGEFRFEKIPAGDYAVLSASDSEYVYWGSSTASAGGTSGVLALSEDSVLVDDFEGLAGANLFHPVTGASWWFTASDSLSSVSPLMPSEARVFSTENPDSSNALHFVFDVDSTAVGAYALCGFDIGYVRGDSISVYDLTALDSVTFFVRGSGHIVMQLAGFDDGGEAGRWDFEFDIPDANVWHRVSVLPSGNDDWERIKTRVRTITFLSTDDAEIWLDRIVFHGVSAQELFRELFEKGER